MIFRDGTRLGTPLDPRFRALLPVLRDDPPAPESLARLGVVIAVAILLGGGFVVMMLLTLERHGYLEPGETLRMLKLVGITTVGLVAYVSFIAFADKRSTRRPRRRC